MLATRVVNVPVIAGDDRAHQPVDGRERVAQRERRQQRRTVGFARQVRDAGEAFRDRAVPRPVGVRTGVAVTVERHDDRAGIARCDVVVGTPPAFEDLARLIERDDVGDFGQPVEDGQAVGVFRVERDRPLVATDVRPHS